MSKGFRCKVYVEEGYCDIKQDPNSIRFPKHKDVTGPVKIYYIKAESKDKK